MPHLTSEDSQSDDLSHSVKGAEDETVDFDQWAGRDNNSDSDEDEDDEDHRLENETNDSINGKDAEQEEGDDDEFVPTTTLEREERDEEFDTTDYVDEVQMKREEDAEEERLAKTASVKASKGSKQKKSVGRGNKSAAGSQQILTQEEPGSEKRKNDDRSPRSQNAGPSSKKKATGTRGPKTADTTKIFKQVDSQSQNRRTCQRLNTGVSTPERTNRWKHAFKTRITFRIKIPSVEKPESALVSILKEFLQELRRVDTLAAILPWKSSDSKSKRIVNADDVPTSTTQLCKYLKKFFVGKPNKETTVYPGIYLGHNTEYNDLREGLQDWLDAGSHAMFYMMLQAEDSTDIGWLLYTTREMDAGAMADEIADLVGVQVGLRWKVIDINVKGKIPDSQKVNALVVEVETEYRWDAQQQLIQYFGKHRKDICEYPNGVRVRFVKNRRDALNASERGKLDRLRSRQQLFLSKIQSHETWDILQLDYNSGPPGSPTLRQMIMGLTINDNTPLFHSVDLDWKGVGYVFQFSPDLKAQAECTIHTLLPLLQHHYPESGIQSNFTQRAVERCKNMVFDEETGTVVDPTVEQSMKFLDEETLPGFTLDLSLLTQSKTTDRSLVH